MRNTVIPTNDFISRWINASESVSIIWRLHSFLLTHLSTECHLVWKVRKLSCFSFAVIPLIACLAVIGLTAAVAINAWFLIVIVQCAKYFRDLEPVKVCHFICYYFSTKRGLKPSSPTTTLLLTSNPYKRCFWGDQKKTAQISVHKNNS